MLQGVGVNVPAGHVVQKLLSLVRQGLSLPLDEKDPLVPVICSVQDKMLYYKVAIIWSLFEVQIKYESSLVGVFYGLSNGHNSPQRARPVRVYLELPSDILRDDQHLRKI